MPRDNSESMIRQLVMALAEAAVNQVIRSRPDLQGLLAPIQGKVIRLKTSEPVYSVYIIVDYEGVQLLNFYDGPVHCRVNGPAWELAKLLFNDTPPPREEILGQIRITGELNVVEQVQRIVRHLDFWDASRALLQEWLPSFSGLSDILDNLRVYDPAWLDRLQHLPQSVSQAVNQLRDLSDLQTQQLEEIRAIRRLLEDQQKTIQTTFMVGWLLLFLAFALQIDLLHIPTTNGWTKEAWLLALMGTALILPVLIQRFRRRG